MKNIVIYILSVLLLALAALSLCGCEKIEVDYKQFDLDTPYIPEVVPDIELPEKEAKAVETAIETPAKTVKADTGQDQKPADGDSDME